MNAPFTWMSGWDRPLLVDRPVRVAGIDLGTTTSTITEVIWSPASSQAPIAEVLEVAQPTMLGETIKSIVPSVVAVHGGREYVGEGAHRLRAGHPVHLTQNREIFWDTKNEIGTRRQYWNAPEGYRTPTDIAGKLLLFLNEAAKDVDDRPLDRVVVTVPASFGPTQREATLQAAKSAGLDLRPGDLMDEPVAAFLDYVVNGSMERLLGARRETTLMVLDFGGGTTDVALLRVAKADEGGLGISRLGVSRFHRIGGGDVDLFIAHEILLPRLLEEHGLAAGVFNFGQKRDFLVPALASLAEQLKIQLVDTLRRQVSLGHYDPLNSTVHVRQPAAAAIPTGHPEIGPLQLSAPALNSGELRQGFSRFLDRVLLQPQEEEYFLATSIFAPIRDVLDRCHLTPADVDVCLMVGGSTLYPGVDAQVRAYFQDADVVTYRGQQDVQQAVGRGAAYHALLLAAYGRSPITATTADALAVQTVGEQSRVLVPRNNSLPFPPDGTHAVSLTFSKGDEVRSVPLRLSLQVGQPGSWIDYASHVIDIPPPTHEGDEFDLRITLDENQRLGLVVDVPRADGTTFSHPLTIDNPLFVTVNPNETREGIRELEEAMPTLDRAGKLRTLEKPRIAASGVGGVRTGPLLPRQRRGSGATPAAGRDIQPPRHRGRRDARHRSAGEATTREAARLMRSHVPLFNLALARQRERRYAEALDLVEEALGIGQTIAARVLRADLLTRLGRADEATNEYRDALEASSDLTQVRDYDLNWLPTAAQALDDEEASTVLREERERRKRRAEDGASRPVADSGFLPRSTDDVDT